MVLPPLLRDVTFLMALYGAIVATVVAVLQWLAHRRDRGEVRLDAAAQRGYSAFTRTPDPEPEVVFTITNVGRRSVQVTHFGVQYKARWGSLRTSRREDLVQPRPELPVELAEGQSRELKGRVFAGLLDAPGMKTLFVRDSLGRRWYLPRRRLLAIRRPFPEIPAEVFGRRSERGEGGAPGAATGQ